MLRVEAVLGRIEPHAPTEVGELLAAFMAEVNKLEGRALERFLESEARRYEWLMDDDGGHDDGDSVRQAITI